ncbi:hypothetical protein L584_12000 [Pantoea agglomerans Tx10]|uniref:hypothetical protein n=1 Tax=Enterobacter agglomerans TaxID=549 RepID=UPI0003B234BC|nr:hypothetical protein [Pantoea agglomerans]ERM10513.1 hypothetical protein L584_12000 [Pantoea agglomerans Tx10]
MNVSDFIMGNVYFENLDFEEIERRFDLSIIEDLSDDDFNRAVINLLNMYLLGNSYVSFRIAETFNDSEELRVYETWIRLLKDRGDMENLILKFITFKLSNKS